MSERAAILPPVRPDFERRTLDARNIGEIERPLPLLERLTNITALRRFLLLVLLAVIWQAYAAWLDNPLIFPTFADTLAALVKGFLSGELVSRTATSIKVLLMGYAAGVALAAVLTGFAVSTRIGTDLLATLTAMFNPLPAIALLPLGLLWFGLGNPSLIFVLIHSVLWAVSLNTFSGFLAVSQTLRMAGHNYGLSGIGYVTRILVPAALPAILTGLKVGWAFAWRTLIAAELVFGVSSGSGGLGWFIYENKNELETANVFAGLFTVIIIGLLVEGVVFRAVENATVRKWGMQQ
ncbi:MAG TPA: ABC transporter permease subunit [Stellaceae bacterium]|nr:ABC transporter permease subunit [Stellaceae bacterium]